MKKVLKLFTIFALILNFSSTFAAVIDHFEVEFNKDKAIVGEALDLTIKAVDENGDIVKDYEGTIVGMSQTDDNVELPSDLASDDGYTFKLSDQGVKKFENGVKFSTAGEQSITVYDINDYQNLIGEGKILIEKVDDNKENVEIQILTPEKNTTLAKSKIKVSGATKKNHQVKIVVNNNKEYLTTSNSDGIFEKEIEFDNGKNVIKAYTLNANNEKIGESDEVIIQVESAKPNFKKIELSPVSETGSVEEGTTITAKVYATAHLKDVKLLFNDQVIKLEEIEDSIYSGNFKAPFEAKKYPIDVILVDNMGHTTTKKNIAFINVFTVEKQSAPVTPVITNTGSTKKECNLKITGIKVVKLKNKSVVTWNKLKDATSYDVYMRNEKTKNFEFVKNVKKPIFEVEITGKKVRYNDFAIRAKNENADCNGTGSVVLGDLSEATKVQTGPTQIIVMIILSLILAFGVMFFKRRNA